VTALERSLNNKLR